MPPKVEKAPRAWGMIPQFEGGMSERVLAKNGRRGPNLAKAAAANDQLVLRRRLPRQFRWGARGRRRRRRGAEENQIDINALLRLSSPRNAVRIG